MVMERIRATINILAVLMVVYFSFLAFLYYARTREGKSMNGKPRQTIQMKSVPGE